MVRLLVSVGLLVTLTRSALAQPPGESQAPITSSDVLLNTPSGRESQWRADLLFGLPLGVRLQRRLGQSRFWAEVGGGLFVISPNLYIGLRSDGTLWDTGRHSVQARPGLVTAYNFGYDLEPQRSTWSLFANDRVSNFGYTAIDCDFSWRARWSDRLHGELGLKLGLGIAYSLEGNANSKSLDLIPVPLIAITLGLNY
jgi:hypothetical protein